MPRHRAPRAAVPAVLLAVLGGVLVLVVVLTESEGDRVGARPGVAAPLTTSGPATTAAGPGGSTALRLLHAWDARRAAAYRTGSPSRLSSLYVPGSAAGAADVRVLRAYRLRGFRVAGMRTQVLALDVLDAGRDRLRIRVSDRLAGADAVRGASRWALPRDETSTRVIAFARAGDGEWRVAAVRDAVPGGALP